MAELSVGQARSQLDHGVSLREAFLTWLQVAGLSFGGPAGQIAVMHRILVEEKRWVSEQRFLHALNYCMLLPGPEAQQLATYIGWLMHRTLGGIIAGGLFVVPGIIAIMALSYVYAAWGNVPVIVALFFGLKAAVLAIVVEALVRIGKRALKNQVMIALAAIALVGIFFFDVPFPIIVFGAGTIGFVAASMGVAAFTTDAGHGAGKDKAGLIAVVTFGGAYAVLAYVAQQAVENYGWLKPGQMLDGLGMAETTPGPLIMVLQFVGFMAAFREPGSLAPILAGTLGGLLATWVTFTPCFLWIFLGAPFIEKLRGNTALNAALSAITAAVVGVILNLAIWFAIHTVFHETVPVRLFPLSFDAPSLASVDAFALALSVAAAVAIFRFKVGMILTLAACCGAGIVLFLFGMLS
ncbi:MAG: chromate transporter [Alphaproteobacteria bacterium]|nr:MAG: chromate transporter [Alphaproteobacteria bacterium]